MTFAIDITFQSDEPRESVQQTVSRLLDAGPFEATALEHVSARTWVLSLGQAGSSVAVNFTKAAELQLLLAREFDLLAVIRTDVAPFAAAS